ncbi:hypothetical protein JCGZ_12902 [Jatropha curcas]|uniref:Uncharacterized protein n=1 Tax=Jatropha curcas TaxID=180498 RepID=A0A067KED5_JATCU|nr:uncharacterized protein LOC105638451 [Jatropha curcas]KDP33353.1 hypothetical protein JCGZ_12902 [Jatropha curcas]
MESGGVATIRGGGLLLLAKPRSKFLFKSPSFYSPIITTTSTFSARYSRWDSNAETVGSKKFNFKFRDGENDDIEEQNEEVEGYRRKGKKRRWWSGESPDMEEEEAPGILEAAIDSLWIFEVVKSYGWLLPPIVISWLLASGPKAFLMTLAIPLGLSALTFVYKLLWGRRQSKPKRKARKRMKPFSRKPSNVEMDEKEQEEMQEAGKGDRGFRSWVVNDDVSVNEERRDASYFGGWDELDGMESKKHPPRRAGQSRRAPSRNGKLGKREKTSDAPLLLRLLIAVFPFLGSWTKML